MPNENSQHGREWARIWGKGGRGGLSMTERGSNITIHRVSEKRPTFTTCYNFYVRRSIATIFGTNVAEKVGNQNALYFPTSPN